MGTAASGQTVLARVVELWLRLVNDYVALTREVHRDVAQRDRFGELVDEVDTPGAIVSTSMKSCSALNRSLRISYRRPAACGVCFRR
jgi:hypothetical protein